MLILMMTPIFNESYCLIMLISSDIYPVVSDDEASPENILNLIRKNIQGSSQLLKSNIK